MSKRRMFNPDIICSGKFLSLSPKAEILYILLCLAADDEGFLADAIMSMRATETGKEELAALIKNGFIWQFDNGVIVILHWYLHNTIQSDRRHDTIFLEEKRKTKILENKLIVLLDADSIRNGYNEDTEKREEEIKIVKPREEEAQRKRNIPSLDDVKQFATQMGAPELVENFYKHWSEYSWLTKDGRDICGCWQDVFIKRMKDKGITPRNIVSAAIYQQRPYDEKQLEDQLGVNEIFKPKKAEGDS